MSEIPNWFHMQRFGDLVVIPREVRAVNLGDLGGIVLMKCGSQLGCSAESARLLSEFLMKPLTDEQKQELQQFWRNTHAIR